MAELNPSAAQIPGAVIAGPGDTVMLCFSNLNDDVLTALGDQLRAAMPGIKWLIVDGVSGVVVMPNEPQA